MRRASRTFDFARAFSNDLELVMTMHRTTLFAALLAAGIAGGAIAQTTQPQPATKSPPPSATPAPPAAGSTGMDKGAGTGSAATTPAPGSSASKALSRSDRRFIEKAAQGGMAEVEMSKLAMEKAQNAQVKEFAKRLVDDHTKANAELMKIASAKGVSPPATVAGDHKRNMDRMAKKSGADFDREYMDDMVDHHQKDVRDFRATAKSANDADLKAFAAATLPTLEQHLQMAKSIESAVKKGGRDSKASTSKSTSTASTSTASTSPATTGAGPSGTAKSTATPGKNTAATTGTAGPGTGMPTSSTQATQTAPQAPGGPADAKAGTPK